MASYQCDDDSHTVQADVVVTNLRTGSVMALCATHFGMWGFGYGLETAKADGIDLGELLAPILAEWTAQSQPEPPQDAPPPARKPRTRRSKHAAGDTSSPPAGEGDVGRAGGVAGGTSAVPDTDLVDMDSGPAGRATSGDPE